MDLSILVVIPARGGSKGIPRKNIRLLAGKPLISYSIAAAKKSRHVDRVVVSTEDEEIAEVSRLFGAEVIQRPPNLAEDHIPLDPVVYHAVTTLENKDNCRFDYVVTIQPTSPLLTSETIDKAIEIITSEDYDTILAAVPERHLYWYRDNGDFLPMYTARKNRQYLDPIYKETGSILMSRRSVITQSSRIGEKVSLFEVPEDESIDIDSYEDWWIAENMLNRLNIVFRVDGDGDIGLGHVHRALMLASRISVHNNVLFLMDATKELGIKKVRESNLPIKTFSDKRELFEVIKDMRPDIVINDILDTKKDYIQDLKKNGYFVINFEDLGEGAELADIVINSLYENSSPPRNHYFGYKYVCLKDEFYFVPQKEVNSDVKRILLTFGGTDPSNLTMRALRSLEIVNRPQIEVRIILGLGYRNCEELIEYIERLRNKGYSIIVKRNVKLMAKEMLEADIAITSNGRTIYELASIGLPCISVAQNEREARHLFVHNCKAIKYLGMAYAVTEEHIASSIDELIDNYVLRRDMSKRLQEYNLKIGIERVIRLIFDGYSTGRKQ